MIRFIKICKANLKKICKAISIPQVDKQIIRKKKNIKNYLLRIHKDRKYMDLSDNKKIRC